NEPRLYLDIFNGRTLTDLHDVYFEVRVATPTSLDRTMVRKAVAEAVGPTAQVNRFGSIEAAIETTLAPDLLLVKLTGFFGVLALGLAAMGLYAMLSYAVARRRGEIGIRMALGARAATVRAMVLGEAMKLVGLGVAIGAVISLAESRAIASLLYDLSPDDPASLAAAALLLATVGLAAAYLPARQASRVDPLPSLRESNQ
ncbi:MAG TPA: FtsX-like permease family protein, partial [Terriglobales bacterium]